MGVGTKFYFQDHVWEYEEYPQKDLNGFSHTHTLKTGTIIIKLVDYTEEEHQKENVVQNPTGKRMIQL